MKKRSFKRTIIYASTLILPQVMMLYIGILFLEILDKILLPVAKGVGVTGFMEYIIPTILSIFFMLVIVFVFVLLMQFSFVAIGRIYLKDILLKMLPSINHLNLLADEKLMTGEVISNWIPVLMKNKESIIPVF